jgi:hypothetical protein
VVAFNGGEAARMSRDYPNLRSEAWFSFADRLPEIDLDDDEQLAADLVAPRYTLDSIARRVVERKDATKKRLGRSPDRADAVLLTFSVPDTPPLAVSGGRSVHELDSGLVIGSLSSDLLTREL